MAQIKKHGAMWYSDFRQDGKRIREPLSPYKDKAEELLADMLALRKAEKTGTAPKAVSWFFFREKYLKQSKLDKKPGTACSDERAFNMVEKYGRPLVRLNQMTPEYLDDLRLKCKEKKLSERTVSDWVRRMKTAMHKAEVWGLAPLQPWQNVKCLSDRKRKDYLSYPDFLKVVAASVGPFKRGAMLMGWAGLRRAEVLHLEWTDVDFKAGVLKIQAKEGWAPKGSKEGEPKERVVAMSEKLEAYLQSLPNKKGLVLGESMTQNYFSKYYRMLGRGLGIKLFPHIFRHTCASFLISTGSTLAEVGDHLGQTDPRSTAIYTHMMPHARRNAVDRMQRGLEKIQQNGAVLAPVGV